MKNVCDKCLTAWVLQTIGLLSAAQLSLVKTPSGKVVCVPSVREIRVANLKRKMIRLVEMIAKVAETDTLLDLDFMAEVLRSGQHESTTEARS